ncbi:MAG: hypothetical protein HY738_13260 [Bacteroidia bacterium]|nr:hypothetical protein [Bacteroidia bacterium]
MYRQVFIPNDTSLLLQIPAYFIGKKVEVIAFPIEEETVKCPPPKKTYRDKEIEKFYRSINIDTKNYQFDREEANERQSDNFFRFGKQL